MKQLASKFHEGSSDKFWCIELTGTSHTVRYGRSGTDGQSKTKDFPSTDKARASYDKLIDQKVKKGYAEVADESQSRSEIVKATKEDLKHHEPFINSILDDPDELGSYSVYADWLQERGDTRGELMSLQLQLEDEKVSAADRKKLAKQETSLLKKHSKEWLGDLAPYLIDQIDKGKHEWRDCTYEHRFGRGFLDMIKSEFMLPEFAKVLKRSGHARMLRRFVVEDMPQEWDFEEMEGYEDLDWDGNPSIKALAGTKFDNLRHFAILDGNGEGVEKLLKNMPRLEEFDCYGRDVDMKAIFKAKLPSLKSLSIDHQTDYPLDILAKNKSLTNLETIGFIPHALEPDDEDAYIDAKGFRAICRSKNLPSLKNISLQGTEIGDEGVKELVSSGLLGRLENIDFEYGTISDEGANLLAEQDLSGLQSLKLASNYLSADAVKAIKKKCKECGVKYAGTEQLSGNPQDEREHLWYGDME